MIFVKTLFSRLRKPRIHEPLRRLHKPMPLVDQPDFHPPAQPAVVEVVPPLRQIFVTVDDVSKPTEGPSLVEPPEAGQEISATFCGRDLGLLGELRSSPRADERGSGCE